jgi:hypothetical protein
VELNYMFAQDWRPDPVLLSHLERKRNAQFYRIWANYFAPAGNPELSVQIPKKWAPFFMSNLLHKDSFNWSKSFLSSDIPSALLESEDETLPLAIPKKCPDGKFLEAVLQEDSSGNVSATSDLALAHPHPSLRWWSLTFGEARDFVMLGLGSGRAPARKRTV